MGNTTKIFLVFTFFLLLFSVFHTGYLSISKTQSNTNIYYDSSANQIEVIVYIFGIDYSKEIAPDLSTNWEEVESGAEESIISITGGLSNFATLENAEVNIYYLDDSKGMVLLPDCSPVKTDKIKNIVYDGETYPVYYGVCTVEKQYIDKNCTRFFAKFEGLDSISPSSTYLPLVICDSVNPVNIFTKYSEGAVKILTEISNDPSRNYICFVSALLFGLLIASMYASGANPLSLLDITTPKLPSPKSFAVSGSILAPMAYGRLGRGIEEAKKSFDNFFRAYNAQSEGLNLHPMYNNAPEYLKALFNRINSGAYDSHTKDKMNNLFLKGVSAGTFGDLRDILNTMKKRGGLDHSIATMAELRVLGEEQNKYMGIFGGGPDRGRSIARTIQTSKAVSYPVNLIGKVPFAGHFIKSSVGNLFSSFQFMKRITRSVASSTIVAATDVADAFTAGKAGRVRQAIGERALEAKKKTNEEIASMESAGIKGNLLKKIKAESLGFIESLAISSDGKYIDIGRIGNIPDFLKKQYEYFMEGALLDVDSYTLKRLFLKYLDPELIGQMNLQNFKTKDFLLHLRELINQLPMQQQAEVIALEQRLIEQLNRIQRIPGESELDYKLRRSEAIVAFARSEGTNLMGLDVHFNFLRNLHRNSIPDEEKFFLLKDHLHEHTEHDPGGAEFYYSSYRENLIYDNMHTDMWNRMLFKSFLENIEHGFAENSHNAGSSILFNSIHGNYGKIVNEMYGIDASIHSDVQIRQIINTARGYLQGLLLPDGQHLKGGLEAALHNSNLKDYAFGDWRESGPLKNWWKVDMKWFWLTNQDPNTSHERTVNGTVTGIFDKADFDPHHVDMERLVSRFGIARDDKRGVYELGYLLDRIKTHLNEDSMNAFGPSARQVADYYKTILAESIRRYVEHFAPEEIRSQYGTGLRNFSSEDIINGVKNGMFKDIIHLMAHGDSNGNHKFFGEKLTYNSYQKGVWARTNEGHMIAINEEVPLSGMDIVLNGVVAYKDAQGNLRKFDPEKQERSGLRKELIHSGEEGKQLLNAINHGQYTPEMLEYAKNLVKENKISAGAYAAIAYSYAKQTHDWTPANTSIRDENGQHLLRLMSTDDFLKEQKGLFSPLNRFFKSAGYAVERNFVNIFGSNAIALDAVNDISSLYRARYHDLSANILGGHFNQNLTNQADRELYNSLKPQYEDVAKKLFKYQTAWDFTIDRHPTGSSTAQGRMLWMESFYHLGPKLPFNVESHSPYYSTMEKGAMIIPNIFVKMQRWAMVPFVSMYRSFKVGTEGTPTTYDISGDPMERWTFKSPSLLEGARSLLNPLYAGINWRAPFGAIFKAPTYFMHHAPGIQHATSFIEEKLDKHGTTSPLKLYEKKVDNWVSKTKLGDPFQKGLLGRADASGYATQPSKELFALGRENSSYWAITANANPADRYYDSRRTLRADVGSAGQLVYSTSSPTAGGPPISSFYSRDEELKSQAASNLIKRTVSPLLHVTEREAEHDMYGSLSGPAFKRRAMMVDPIGVGIWRVGAYAVNKFKNYQDARSLGMSMDEYNQQMYPHKRGITQSVYSYFKRKGESMKYAYKITAPQFMGGIGVIGRVYCPNCRTIKTRGSQCPGCGR
ncbi:MAG: hypothetical protein WC501_02350 [Candidatus Micrarchaeia archaeon]